MDRLIHNFWYRVINVIIYYKDRIYLVPRSKLKQKLLKEVQDSPLAGHVGEIFMEGTERGHVAACEGMYCLPIEQIRTHSSCRTVTAYADSRT